MCEPFRKSFITFSFCIFSFSSHFLHIPFLIPLSLPPCPHPAVCIQNPGKTMAKLLRNLRALYFGSIQNARSRIITISTRSGNPRSSSCRQKGQLSPPGRRQHSLVTAQPSFPVILNCEMFWKGWSRLSPRLTNVPWTLNPCPATWEVTC